MYIERAPRKKKRRYLHVACTRTCTRAVGAGVQLELLELEFSRTLQLSLSSMAEHTNKYQMQVDLALLSEDELKDLATKSSVSWMGLPRRELVLNLRQAGFGQPETSFGPALVETVDDLRDMVRSLTLEVNGLKEVLRNYGIPDGIVPSSCPPFSSSSTSTDSKAFSRPQEGANHQSTASETHPWDCGEAARVDRDLKLQDLPAPTPLSSSSLQGIHFRPSTVRKHLARLVVSKATGPDGISCRVLKECCKELASPIAKLFSLCFSVGIQPEIWKLAHVVLSTNAHRGQLPQITARCLCSACCPRLWKVLLITNW